MEYFRIVSGREFSSDTVSWSSEFAWLPVQLPKVEEIDIWEDSDSIIRTTWKANGKNRKCEMSWRCPSTDPSHCYERLSKCFLSISKAFKRELEQGLIVFRDSPRRISGWIPWVKDWSICRRLRSSKTLVKDKGEYEETATDNILFI